jgi:hypothetical protein
MDRDGDFARAQFRRNLLVQRDRLPDPVQQVLNFLYVSNHQTIGYLDGVPPTP